MMMNGEMERVMMAERKIVSGTKSGEGESDDEGLDGDMDKMINRLMMK